MIRPERPPRFARALLERALPAELREPVTADLDEIYGRRALRRGVARARWWYRAQALSFAFRFLWERLRERTDGGIGERWRMMKVPAISALDFKLGIRMLRRYPGLSLIGGMALSVAIAIGVLTFEVVVQELSPSLPFEDGDRIVRIENWDRQAGGPEPHALYDLQVWQDGLRSLEQIGAARSMERNLIFPEVPPRPIPVAEVTPSAFALTRVPPLLGRTLLEADAQPGAPEVVVIGHEVWQRELDGDPGMIGRTVQLGETRATVVGIMPEGFGFPRFQQAWLPLRETVDEPGEGPPVVVFARLVPGATLERARAEVAGVGQRLAAADPAFREHLQPRVVPFASAVGPNGLPIVVYVMLVGVFLVLLAVSANVATLMFARTALRESEIVVRNALGATRGRVIVQLLVESLVLAGAATLAGMLIAWGILRFLWYQAVVVRQVPWPFWRDADLEPATVLWAAGLALIGAVLVGLLPALKATGAKVQSGLAQSTAGASGLRFGGVWSFVIIAQVALTVLCLPIAMGASRETFRDHRVRSAFASQGFLTFEVQFDGLREGEQDEAPRDRLERAHQELERRLLAEPGVDAVTLGSGLPGTNHPLRRLEAQRGDDEPFMVQGNTEGRVRMSRVTSGFFDVFGLPLVAGRGFDQADLGASTVVVNESLARNLGGNPLGTHVRYPAEEGEEPGPWHEVVGVVTNAGMEPTDGGEADFIYHAAAPFELYPGYIAARVRGAADGLAPRVSSIALDVDPALRVYDVLTLDEVVRRRDLPTLVTTVGANVVVAMAIMLSAAGLFALMVVAVERRTREIGIRLALGAGSQGVIRAVFARAAAQLGAGIVLGNLLVVGVFRLLAGGLQLSDLVLPMMGVSILMTVVGVAACTVPALRALRVQPTEALKGVG